MALTPGTLTVMLDAAWRVTLVLAVAWGATRPAGPPSGGRAPRGLGDALCWRRWRCRCSPASLPSWRLAVLPARHRAAPSCPLHRNVPPHAVAASAAACHRDARRRARLTVEPRADRRLPHDAAGRCAAVALHGRLAGPAVGERRRRDHRPLLRQRRLGALADARRRAGVRPALARCQRRRVGRARPVRSRRRCWPPITSRCRSRAAFSGRSSSSRPARWRRGPTSGFASCCSTNWRTCGGATASCRRCRRSPAPPTGSTR